MKDGGNWYVYCGNDPVNRIDPSGNIAQGYTDKNGKYHANPDAEEFGRRSSTYQQLVSLGNLWMGTKDKDLRDTYHSMAEIVRLGARTERSKLPVNPLPTFEIDKKQGIYYAPQEPLQKKAGYHNIYDAAFSVACNMKTIKSIFDYKHKSWRVQLWKGNYLNMGLGGEIGVYKKDDGNLGKVDFYDAAEEGEQLKMSFALYKDNGTTPVFIRYDSDHWWLNGFQPYQYMDADKIRMIGGISFDTSEMANAFTGGLEKNDINYVVNGLRVDFDWK